MLNDIVLTSCHAEDLEDASTEVWGQSGRCRGRCRGGVGVQVVRNRLAARVSCGSDHGYQSSMCEICALHTHEAVSHGVVMQSWARFFL